MATVNSFGLLGDDDTEDLSLLVSVQKQKADAKKAAPPSAKLAVALAAAKLPSKPLPPAQAVREEKTELARTSRGGGHVYGRGRGRGRVAGFGLNNDSTNESGYGNKEMNGAMGAAEGADSGRFFERRGGYDGSRGPFRGGRRGGLSNGQVEEGEQERPRRHFDCHSGTGHRSEIKREGTGRGNWGTPADQPSQVVETVVNEGETIPEKLPEDDPTGDEDKEISTNDVEEKEPEDKEMTLEEYEKVLEKKRMGLQPLKTKERKVDAKEFKAMQLLNKKTNDDIFIKLGSDKDKRKEVVEKEDKSKKSISINEFLKPPEGERYHSTSSRNRGRGHGSRGGYGRGSSNTSNIIAPSIEDPTQFPTLGVK